jgi:hypothetical protein
MVNEAFLRDLNPADYGYTFDTPYDDRDEKFYYSVVMNMMGDYWAGNLMQQYNWKNAGGRTFQELRSYATGKQDVNKYKSYLIADRVAQSGKFKGQKVSYMNISWEAVKVLPKLVDIIVNTICSVEYDAQVEAIDPQSIIDKTFSKALNRILLAPQMKEFIQKMQKGGAKITMQSAFKDVDEMETHESVLGLQLFPEMALQDCLEKTNIDSRYKEIIRQFIYDLVTIGTGVIMDYTEQFSNEVLYRYIDSAYYLSDYSEYADSRDATRAGHFEMMQLGEIRRRGDVSDDELREIAKNSMDSYGNLQFKGRFPNGQFNKDSKDMYYQRFGYMPFYDVRVPVFHLKFIGTEPVGKYRHEYQYKVSWVVGTKIIFDYGKDSYCPKRGRDGNMKVQLSYHSYKLQDSAVERVIGLVDDICLNTYKERNLIANLPPAPRAIFNAKAFNSVNVGGSIMTTADNMASFVETGKMYMNPVDRFNDPTGNNYQKAVETLPSGIAEDMNMLNNSSALKYQQIKDILGINEFVDASTPNPRAGLGIAKIATQASLNSMKGYLFALEATYGSLMNACLGRWQMAAATGYKGVFRSFTEEKQKIIELTKDVYLRQYGVYVSVSPTDAEVQELMLTITQLRNNRLTGMAGGISPQQYLILYKLLKQRNIDEAIWLLGKYEKQNKDEAAKEAEARTMQTGEVQIASSQASEEEKRKTQALKTQGDLLLQEKKNDGEVIKTAIEKLFEIGIIKDEQDFQMAMTGLESGQFNNPQQSPAQMPTLQPQPIQ